jgi:hypothetical protein
MEIRRRSTGWGAGGVLQRCRCLLQHQVKDGHQVRVLHHPRTFPHNHLFPPPLHLHSLTLQITPQSTQPPISPTTEYQTTPKVEKSIETRTWKIISLEYDRRVVVMDCHHHMRLANRPRLRQWAQLQIGRLPSRIDDPFCPPIPSEEVVSAYYPLPTSPYRSSTPRILYHCSHTCYMHHIVIVIGILSTHNKTQV